MLEFQFHKLKCKSYIEHVEKKGWDSLRISMSYEILQLWSAFLWKALTPPSTGKVCEPGGRRFVSQEEEGRRKGQLV